METSSVLATSKVQQSQIHFSHMSALSEKCHACPKGKEELKKEKTTHTVGTMPDSHIRVKIDMFFMPAAMMVTH